MKNKRVGTLTSGITLVAAGIIFLIYTLVPRTTILIQSFKFWPIILISLGVETLIKATRKEGDGYKFDFASVLMMLLCLLFAFACEISRQAMLYHLG